MEMSEPTEREWLEGLRPDLEAAEMEVRERELSMAAGVRDETSGRIRNACTEAVGYYDGFEEAMPYAFRVLLDVARCFAEGELPPKFPTDEDVIALTRWLRKTPGVDCKLNTEACRLALRAVADARGVYVIPNEEDEGTPE